MSFGIYTGGELQTAAEIREENVEALAAAGRAVARVVKDFQIVGPLADLAAALPKPGVGVGVIVGAVAAIALGVGVAWVVSKGRA